MRLWTAIKMTFVLTLLTGIIYPVLITVIGETIFPFQAHGSLITRDGHVVGSQLIGQNFSTPGYFHPRPSAAGNGYDPTSSSGSNLGPLNADLAKRIAGDADALRKSTGHQQIPDDAITTS